MAIPMSVSHFAARRGASLRTSVSTPAGDRTLTSAGQFVCPSCAAYLPTDMAKRVLPAGFIEPCIPILAAKPPHGAGWVHEIKHDGYRLIVRREGARVRLFTRRGYDWTKRLPVIAAASLALRARSFTLDGEAV